MSIWISIALVAIPVLLSLLYWFAKSKAHEQNLKKLHENRPTLSKTAYVEYFLKLGYKKERIDVLYQELNKFIKHPGFSIYPEDDLLKMYGLDGLDDVLLIKTICEKLSIQKPEQEDLDYLEANFKVFDAEQIMNFLDYLEHKQD